MLILYICGNFSAVWAIFVYKGDRLASMIIHTGSWESTGPFFKRNFIWMKGGDSHGETMYSPAKVNDMYNRLSSVGLV